jgi:hypothetical protein
MNIKEQFEKIKKNLRKPSIRSSIRAYAGNSLINQPKFKSGFDCGEEYILMKEGKEIKGELICKPLSMKEYKNTGLDNVPLFYKIKERLEEFDMKGGQIVFSTDVNAELKDDKGLINKIKNFVKGKLSTLKNRLLAKKKLKKIMKEKDVYAFSIGNFFDGQYKDEKGNYYSEKSLSVEIIGISFEELEFIAEMIRKEFQQESVLIKDYESGKINLLYK